MDKSIEGGNKSIVCQEDSTFFVQEATMDDGVSLLIDGGEQPPRNGSQCLMATDGNGCISMSTQVDAQMWIPNHSS
jgi:hypothetical protein